MVIFVYSNLKMSWSAMVLNHCAGDVVTRHNCIRDCIADFCRRAHLSPLLEQGCGIGPAKDRSRPADILIPNWSLSRSAAFDIKVIHPLNNSLISDAGQTSGASAAAGETREIRKQCFGLSGKRLDMCPSSS